MPIRLWSKRIFHDRQQARSGVVPVTHQGQAYQLQNARNFQILWPLTSGPIYYRSPWHWRWQKVPANLRSYVADYFQEVTATIAPQLAPESATLAVITDTHIKFTPSRSYYGFNGWQHLQEFFTLSQKLPSDLLLHLGDVIDGSDNPTTDRQFLQQVGQSFDQQKKPFWILKGNHDDHDKFDEHQPGHRATFTADTFEHYIGNLQLQQTAVQTVEQVPGFGYWDHGSVRVIFLNTSDVPFTLTPQGRRIYDHKLVLGMQQRQIQALIKVLEDSANRTILICSHANLVTAKGRNGLQHNGKLVHDLLRAFNQGLSGRVDHHEAESKFDVQASFDFRTNQTGRIRACLAGHRHLETNFQVDQINYIILNNSALMGRRHGLTTRYNRAWDRKLGEVSEFAGYVVNLNPQTGWLYVWGYGAASPVRKFKV
ncbi:metallophosphoesterase [Lactobacillus sp. DCY120]|uniref:Metallophosphoesterase n=1 Tax=Bombilactobacillus apium TaxID=2675299 RepID=A0A850R6Y8_9LACO|nr:metallophosphoesterase [Bombilactobacillus apium]NVY96412.1 metallophosphoesterase [Bombilactobacillus apium]